MQTIRNKDCNVGLSHSQEFFYFLTFNILKMQTTSNKAIAKQIAKTHTEMRLQKLARLERAINKYLGDDGLEPILDRFIDFSQDILTGYFAKQMGRKYCAEASYDLARVQQLIIKLATICEKAEKI